MSLELDELPKYLVLEPGKGVRLEMRLSSDACEIDVELERPRSGRSFVVMVGHVGGPIVQRVRLAGKAQIYFAPEKAGDYVLVLSNPMEETAVIRLSGLDVPARAVVRAPRKGAKTRSGANGPHRNRSRARTRPSARRPSASAGERRAH